MYAGPVGWFGGGESEFAVGIRSALVEKVSFCNVIFTFALNGVSRKNIDLFKFGNMIVQ
jgi:isochorismate synthase EntC